MKNVISMATIGLMAIAIAGTQLNLNAQEAGSTTASVQAAKPKTIPFHGTLKGIDKEAGTVTVGSRTFTLTENTTYLQGSVDEAKVGDKVGGSYWKAEDGVLMVNSIRFGPKPGKAATQATDE
jgi:Cu/Ag efflux protein CusF